MKQIFDENRFIKNLFKVNEKNNSGVLRINQIIYELITLSKGLQLNCYQIATVVSIVTLYFEHAEYFTYHVRNYIILNHS